MLLEKVLSVIPETVDPAKINGLFNAVSVDRYIRRDEEVWLPVLIALADLVEILQSSPEARTGSPDGTSPTSTEKACLPTCLASE